jgi:selenocysteine-specific elongation factor
VILGTAGHIDHGKTALVKALTGVDTDRLPEEKRRGITIDLGFAPLELEGIGTVGVVDVPGHEAFVRTMLAGASGIDAALLVVAADEGVMPQTREHLEILSLLGVTNIVVAVTKRDLVDADWLPLVADEVHALFSARQMEPADIIAVSATTREGLGELRAALIDALSRDSHNQQDEDLFRMPVDRAFTVRGTGTVVTGTVWSGSIRRDQSVFVHPGGRALRIRGIQTHGRGVSEAMPGQRAALALASSDISEVERGTVLVASPAWSPTTRFVAQVRLMPDSPPINARTRLRLHLGTSEVEARLSFSPVDHGIADTPFVTRIRLDEPIIARAGDKFVLRLPSPVSTIGGGTVLDPYPTARSARFVTTANSSDPTSLLSAALEAAGTFGIHESILPIRVGVAPAMASKLANEIGAEKIDGRIVSGDALSALMEEMESSVKNSVANSPLEPGVQLQTLRAELRAPAPVIDHVLFRLMGDDRLELDGALVRPAGWSPKLSDRQIRERDALLREICAAASDPPSVSELESKVGSDAPALLRLLTRSGDLVKVSEERYYSVRAVGDLVARLRGTLDPERFYPPSELREVLGISRKYLIPFLEFCDRTGVTERGAQGRRLLPQKVIINQAKVP